MTNPFTTKYEGKPHGGYANTGHKFKFPNGYGASVVRGEYTYGGSEGLWELAVLGHDGDLTYDTPITDDVIGYRTEAEIADLLDAIAALPEPGVL